MQAFDQAVESLGSHSKNCLKHAKLYFYKGMALKRSDSERSLETFRQQVSLTVDLLKVEESYLIAQSFLEVGGVMRKQKKYEEAQNYLT